MNFFFVKTSVIRRGISQFHEIVVEEKIANYNTVWENGNLLYLTLFWQKFRESNNLVKKLVNTNYVIDLKKNFSGEGNFFILSLCSATLLKLRKFTHTLFWQKFRESNEFTKEITK